MKNQQLSNEEYLNQIETLTRRITYHREQLLRLRLEAESVSSRWRDLSGIGGGTPSGDASYVRKLEQIEEKEVKLKREEDLLFRLRAQAEAAIESLPTEDMRLVLLYIYLERKNMIQIGGLMHTSRRSVFRLRDEAMALLVLPDDAINIFCESWH